MRKPSPHEGGVSYMNRGSNLAPARFDRICGPVSCLALSAVL
jgi:hypothetical protein